jgi:aspartyl/glutamyl-tRNA(Asn/Gln) amidotransferase C subunit
MDKSVIKKTQDLAKLTLNKGRFNKISSNLSDIVDYIGILQRADVKDLPDNFNASGLKNITVGDKPIEVDHLTQQQANENAKRSYKGYVQVEKVI